MIDRNDVDAYRRITAPDSLRQRVFAAPARRSAHAPVRWQILSAAACLVLVLGSLFSLRFFPASVSYDTSAVNAAGVAIVDDATAQRSAEVPQTAACEMRQISLTISTHARTTVSASGGTLMVLHRDGAAENVGMQAEISGNTDLYWEVTAQELPLVLTVTTPQHTTAYLLEETDEGWLLKKTT